MNWDETDGWVFSEEYHNWQDRNLPGSSFRAGAIGIRENYGYAMGLYGIKTDWSGQEPDATEAAEWPEPNYRHNLNRRQV